MRFTMKRRGTYSSSSVTAGLWCHIAIKVQGNKTGAKPWSYLLVPESAVQPNATITGLEATYTRSADAGLISRFDLSKESDGIQALFQTGFDAGAC